MGSEIAERVQDLVRGAERRRRKTLGSERQDILCKFLGPWGLGSESFQLGLLEWIDYGEKGGHDPSEYSVTICTCTVLGTH